MPVLRPEVRYSSRLNKAINFAHAYSRWNIQLDQLADIACLSKYHFTRIFQDQVGEAPVSFLKRARLERAASMLQNRPNLSIKEIAFYCGFTSNQLFSRKFGHWFGRCPSEFRLDHLNSAEDKIGWHQSRIETLPAKLLNLECDIQKAAEQINIVEIPPTRVAYVRSIGGYGECENIAQAFEAIVDWGITQNIWTEDSKITGISWDFPSITPNNKCRYDACLALPPGYVGRSGISQQLIQGGYYATASFTYRNSSDLLPIWRWFSLTLGNAIKFDGFEADLTTGPWFETLKPTSNSAEYLVELFTRVKPIKLQT